MREVVAIVHNVRSIHNVGSIFRTADGAGIKKIFLVGVTPTPRDRFGNIMPQFSKVALGAEKNIEWEKVSSLSRLFTILRKENYIICALEQSKNSVPYTAFLKKKDAAKKIALIVGSEVRGIPPAILKKADAVIEIPMRGKKESLNVSVAFGIAIYALKS